MRCSLVFDVRLMSVLEPVCVVRDGFAPTTLYRTLRTW